MYVSNECIMAAMSQLNGFREPIKAMPINF